MAVTILLFKDLLKNTKNQVYASWSQNIITFKEHHCLIMYNLQTTHLHHHTKLNLKSEHGLEYRVWGWGGQTRVFSYY